MEPLYLVVQEEIALEGLDGITLDALWFRLSERLKLELPFNKNFQSQIWKLIQSYRSVKYYEIKNDRRTPQHMDRKDYLFNESRPKEEVEAFMKKNYFIYSYDPVDHPDVRGSCKELKTRKLLKTDTIKEMSLDDVTNTYCQKLVIVASQSLRNSMLIPKNAGLDCDINNHAYCVLERIGRARHFGEMTSGAFSINDFVKDSKLIHYFRNTLLKHGLVVRQQIQKKLRGNKLLSQLFHLPRFLVIIKTGIALHLELLFEMLQTKPTLMAELDDARKTVGINQKALKLLVQTKNTVFKINEKCPYRKCYPDAKQAQYLNKNPRNTFEKTITTVELIDPNFDVYMMISNPGEEPDSDAKGFLDISRQQYNRPLSHQVCQKIEESAKEGMSQLEIGTYFGLTKLNSRSVVRNISRMRDISFYMKDEGRQRVSKYVTKDAAEDASATFIAEMAKLLKKADDLTAPPIIQHKVEAQSSQSPTKVSIQLSPKTLKYLKDEPPSSRPVITYTMQGDDDEPMTVDKVHCEDSDKRLIIPLEESSFIDNVENVAVSLRFLNNIPNIKKETSGIAKALMQNRISQKVLNRMNVVLDLIKNCAVIEALKLLQLLREQEREQDGIGEMCRKSMFSLCGKLAADNLLKVIEMELKSDKKTVVLMFFGEPNISFDMRCWHSIIEEQKLQHFIPFHRTNQELSASLQVIESKTSIGSEDFGPQSKRYENFPKFMKMKLFHEFLYYLIYAFPDNYRKIPISKALESWKRENPKIHEYDGISDKITNCYSTEISWKMFVSPLNPQLGFGDGWGLVRDIIHRIPLILFVKFTRMVTFTPELQEYLDHPIKSNYLLHFLPAVIREQLLRGRKYVFVVQDLCKKLAWCGLLQFGPSRTKEIDQVIVYLNRNASLWDTTSSAEGYLEVSDKAYPVIEYTFNSIDDVTNYWNKMYQISINTRINKKSTAIGKTVEVEQINSKAGLQGALKVQTPRTAAENDNGMIPGDHKGAAGLDKAFLAHLVQNWTRPIGNRKSKQSRAISAASLSSKLSATSSNISTVSKPKKKTVKNKKTVVKEAAKKIKIKTIQAVQSKFKSKTGTPAITKVIQKTAQTHVEKQKALIAQDIVDKQALKMMKTMRVTWSEVEDKTLLLAKVALRFLFPVEAQSIYYINASIIRDILHWRTEKAMNKTSKACSRRIQYLMKTKPSFKEQLALYIEELRTNKELMAKYRNFIDRLKKIYPAEQIHDAVKVHFVEIVFRTHQIFFKQFLGGKTVASVERIYDLPSDYAELQEKYTISNPVDSLVTRKYHDPETVAEAEIAMLMSLIHSSVCCAQDKVSYSTQLFEIFKKFTDPVLNSAVAQLRRAAIISGAKKDKNKTMEKDKKSILPYSFAPYHLTTRYATQIAGIHVPVELYDEYLSALKAVSDSDGPCLITNINCGWTFLLSELRNCGKIHLSYDQAESLVMVDPALVKKSTFDKISDNYLQMMKKGDQEKKSVKLPADDTSNETFFFIDDPIEIFMKIDAVFLHTFCIAKAIVKGDDVNKKKFCISDDGYCSLKNCIVKDDLNFASNARKIAEQSCELLKAILEKKIDSQNTSNYITKHNFVEFFEEILENHFKVAETNNRKDFSAKPARLKKLTLKEILECIIALATEPGLEQDSWITDYKKVSHTAEEENLDDEDAQDTTGEQIKHSKMFNQLKDLNVNNRTCDSFVVNLSTIYVEPDEDFGPKIRFDGAEFGLNLLPFIEVDRAGFIEKIQSEAKFTPQDLSETDLFEAVTNAGITNTLHIMKVSEVCDFVHSKAQIGVKSLELLNMFADRHQLHTQMETLIQLKFVFRVGVIETRFVHKEFAAFWLVDSFFTTRGDSGNAGNKRKAGGDGEEEPAAKQMKNYRCEPSTSKAAAAKEAAKKEPVICNPLRVRPSPWIRVNGTLNRRVFDKWLGTILNHLTLHPCMMLADLCHKFNVLTPFDVRSLCEYLQMIGCVEMMATSEQSHDLFSSYDGCDIKPATFFCAPDYVFIEVKNDAMLRLTLFIGKKKYKTPFV